MIGVVCPVLLALHLVHRALLRRKVPFTHYGAALGIALLAFIHLISMAWTPDPSGALNWNGFLFGLLCWFVFVSTASSGVVRSGRLILASALGGAVAAGIGLIQSAGVDVPPFQQTLQPGSTFVYANIGAQFFAMVVPAALALTWGARTRGRVAVWSASFALAAAYLIATRTRGAWIGAAVGVLVVAAAAMASRTMRQSGQARLRLKLATAGVVIVAMCVTAWWLPRTGAGARRATWAEVAKSFQAGWQTMVDDDDAATDASIKSRTLMLRCAGRAIRDHWLFGLGSDGFRAGIVPYLDQPTADLNMKAEWQMLQLHCEPVQLVLETGVIGGIGLLLVIATVVRAGWRTMRTGDDPDSRWLVLGCLGGLAAVGVHSLVSFPMHMPASALLATTLAAVPLALDRDQKAGADDTSQPRRWVPWSVALVVATLAVANARVSVSVYRAMRHLQEAVVAKSRDDAVRALERINLAMEASSLPYAVRREYGVIHAKYNDDREAARECLIASLRHDPNYINNLVNLAGVNMELGRFTEARDQLRKALSINDNVHMAHYALGLIAMEQGDHEAARRSFERVLEIDGNFTPAIQYLAELEQPE